MSKPKFTSTAGPVGRPGGGKLKQRYSVKRQHDRRHGHVQEVTGQLFQRNRQHRRVVAALRQTFAAWGAAARAAATERPGDKEKLARMKQWALSYLPASARGTE